MIIYIVVVVCMSYVHSQLVYNESTSSFDTPSAIMKIGLIDNSIVIVSNESNTLFAYVFDIDTYVMNKISVVTPTPNIKLLTDIKNNMFASIATFDVTRYSIDYSGQSYQISGETKSFEYRVYSCFLLDASSMWVGLDLGKIGFSGNSQVYDIDVGKQPIVFINGLMDSNYMTVCTQSSIYISKNVLNSTIDQLVTRPLWNASTGRFIKATTSDVKRRLDKSTYTNSSIYLLLTNPPQIARLDIDTSTMSVTGVKTADIQQAGTFVKLIIFHHLILVHSDTYLLVYNRYSLSFINSYDIRDASTTTLRVSDIIITEYNEGKGRTGGAKLWTGYGDATGPKLTGRDFISVVNSNCSIDSTGSVCTLCREGYTLTQVDGMPTPQCTGIPTGSDIYIDVYEEVHRLCRLEYCDMYMHTSDASIMVCPGVSCGKCEVDYQISIRHHTPLCLPVPYNITISSPSYIPATLSTIDSMLIVSFDVVDARMFDNDTYPIHSRILQTDVKDGMLISSDEFWRSFRSSISTNVFINGQLDTKRDLRVDMIKIVAGRGYITFKFYNMSVDALYNNVSIMITSSYNRIEEQYRDKFRAYYRTMDSINLTMNSKRMREKRESYRKGKTLAGVYNYLTFSHPTTMMQTLLFSIICGVFSLYSLLPVFSLLTLLMSYKMLRIEGSTYLTGFFESIRSPVSVISTYTHDDKSDSRSVYYTTEWRSSSSRYNEYGVRREYYNIYYMKIISYLIILLINWRNNYVVRNGRKDTDKDMLIVSNMFRRLEYWLVRILTMDSMINGVYMISNTPKGGIVGGLDTIVFMCFQCMSSLYRYTDVENSSVLLYM